MDARQDLLRLNVSGLSRSSSRKGGTDQPHHATSEGAMRVGAVLFGIGAIREEAQRGLVYPRRYAIRGRPDLLISNDGPAIAILARRREQIFPA
jgi:hypothetical protein